MEDTDGDEVNDHDEVVLGADPLNAQIRPGVIKIGTDVRVSHGEDLSTDSVMVWTGSGFGLSWQDRRDGNFGIYFAFLSADGETVVPEFRVTQAVNDAVYPSMAWTGSEFGVSWQDNRAGTYPYFIPYLIYFTRVSVDGDTVGPELRITFAYDESDYYPSLAWSGSEFGLGWTDAPLVGGGGYSLIFTRLSAEGAGIGGYTHFAWDGSIFGSPWPHSLIWAGSQYATSWDTQVGNDVGCISTSSIDFIRISEAGDRIGDQFAITSGCWNASDPSLAWTGSEFGVSWHFRDGWDWEIDFARVSADGQALGDVVTISFAPGSRMYPSLTWADGGFGVAWEDDRDGVSEIYFARISADGHKVAADNLITPDPASSQAPSLAWAGSEFGVSWIDGRDGNDEVYFARFAYDSDGDGLIDEEENSLYLTDPADWDTDGDLISDGEEIARGLNPLWPEWWWLLFDLEDNDATMPTSVNCALAGSQVWSARLLISLLVLALPGIIWLGLRRLPGFKRQGRRPGGR